ncbi:helix-turn-helix domain-containing protein [Streptomyces venezuelae]|nr:helix-turn-helix transcriptional regulator [Streptomyces venezuelae]
MEERNDGVDEPGWDVDPEDEISSVVEMVGNQLKLRREVAGMSVAQFAVAIGYGEDLVRKVERGARIPRPEYLDKVDEVVGAGGFVSAMKKEMREARYPKRVRELAKLEERAAEVAVYASHGVHGLLQTEEHSRVVFRARQPAYSQEEVERFVTARMARQSIFGREPAPSLSFVQEEAALRRPIGGTMVWRQQLERLLEVGELPHVTLQVMPIDCEAHPGLDGDIEVLKFGDGTAVGRSDGAFNGRPVTEPKQLRILELRYGIIRAQALTPRETRTFVERVLGET